MRKQGFTLVELTVVIAILAILAGIAVPAMAGYRDKAAEGVNEVNLLTAQRQLRMIWDNSQEDFSGVSGQMQAVEELFSLGSWQVSAPRALGVRRGEHPVEAGTDMKAWLDENEEWTTSYEDGAAGIGEEGAGPAPEAPVPETTETVPPAVAPHGCRDREPHDCICDVPGCGLPVHETGFRDDGNCEYCGTHFQHIGMEDQICDACALDETTGQTHVCSWEDGECRCRCGASRCDHGTTGMLRCSYCGLQNFPRTPCPNCN